MCTCTHKQLFNCLFQDNPGRPVPEGYIILDFAKAEMMGWKWWGNPPRRKLHNFVCRMTSSVWQSWTIYVATMRLTWRRWRWSRSISQCTASGRCTWNSRHGPAFSHSEPKLCQVSIIFIFRPHRICVAYRCGLYLDMFMIGLSVSL